MAQLPTWTNLAFKNLSPQQQEAAHQLVTRNLAEEKTLWQIVHLSLPGWRAVMLREAGSTPQNNPFNPHSPGDQLDYLTQLSTRATLLQLAELWKSDPRRCRFGLMFLDLDDFKQINDSVGHIAGDERLREVAAVLAASLRDEDFIARYGGDEFVVLVAGDPSADSLRHLAKRLSKTLKEQTGIGASIGVALSGEHPTFTDLLAAADAEMYAEKQRREK